MIFTAARIAAACRGRLVAEGPAGPVTTDTRRVAAGAWFVALAGERFDGHDFLAHAAASGCAGAVVRAGRVPDGWDRGLVEVGDPLLALQDLGRDARASFEGPVVGITGSAGKTSTRAMVVSALAALGRVHHTVGNLNNHIGVPLTLCARPPDAELMVVEMGMSHPGEIALLQEIARPQVRLITNVGPAHVEGCGSIEGVARAKQELFDGAAPGDILCVNTGDPFIAVMPHPPGVRVIPYGRGADDLVRLTDVAVDAERLQTRLRIETPEGVVRATLEVPGEHLAWNALAATAVAFALRVPAETVGPALSRFAPEGMRNRVERVGPVLVIDDAYNANPLSMGAGLRTLAGLPGRRVALLGDMMELGTAEAAGHTDVLRLALDLGVEVRVAGPRMTAAAAPLGIAAWPDAASLAAAVVPTLEAGDVVLVKGSRSARMEVAAAAVRARFGNAAPSEGA